MINDCLEVHVFQVCGKQARKLAHEKWVEIRRRRLLKRLILERRMIRKILSKSDG